MRIDELDECQLLTREMVDSYLNHKGWCNLPDPESRLLKPWYVQITFSMGLVRAVEQIAEIEGRTVQALLREINPRMRKGTPSLAAWEAHGGEEAWWLAADHDNHTEGSSWEKYRERPIVTQLRQWVRSDNAIWWTYGMPGIGWMGPVARPDWKASFWPCDANGNKIRWPTDEHGNLL